MQKITSKMTNNISTGLKVENAQYQGLVENFSIRDFEIGDFFCILQKNCSYFTLGSWTFLLQLHAINPAFLKNTLSVCTAGDSETQILCIYMILFVKYTCPTHLPYVYIHTNNVSIVS